jgi:magnesium and cobalt exporter, CNNM family
MTLGAAIVLFALAVVMQALLAGYETGFISLNPIRLRHQAVDENNRRAARLLRHVETPDRLLTALLIGTNIATAMGTIAVAKQLNELGAALIVAPVLLVFAEIIPKSVFRTHPNRLSLALLPVIRVFYAVLAPVALPVAWVTRSLFSSANAEGEKLSPMTAAIDDMQALVDETADNGSLEPDERRMIHRVMSLQTKLAKEHMVPRIDVQALPDTATRAELLALFEETGRTRIPIYHDTIDSILGVINAHDVLLDAEPDNDNATRFIREVMHVPDSMKLDDLLASMKADRHHMAIVTDEYGGTDGLITIEDVLEEIFGEIQDEHDSEERPIQQVGPRAFVIDARMPLDQAAEAMRVTIEDAEVETVGGWVMHMAGRIPAQGEVLELQSFSITVLEGGKNHLGKVRLDLPPEGSDDTAKKQ